MHLDALKGNLSFFQPGPYLPMFLCQSDRWEQQHFKSVQH